MSEKTLTEQRAFIYCRVAANNDLCAAENGIGIAAQKTLCVEYAAKKGYNVSKVFTDFAPGLTLKRDGMKSLTAALKAREVNAVIVKDFDRIARNIHELERFNSLCERYGVIILSALHDTSYNDPQSHPLHETMVLLHKKLLSTKI